MKKTNEQRRRDSERQERLDLAHRNAAHLDMARAMGCKISDDDYAHVWSMVDGQDNEIKAVSR